MKSKWLAALAVMAVLVLTPLAAHAQLSTGDIYGTLLDETGGVLPGVTVTLTGNLIGTMTQVTGVNGDFHFIRLSPGDYDLQCELDGFSTYVQKLIAVQTGGAVNLKITMKPTTVAETITVTAEQPILDTKKTGVGQNVTNEVLANIPTARDPWVVMSMVSGIIVDRVNIAGAEGGQQSEFTSRGDVGGDNSMWNMDGVTITDMAATGSSPTYYDFDGFEEIQVTTGGNDPSQATGGMGINFVTKRGGDTPKGSARFYTTSEGLQSDNTKDLATPDHGGSTELDGYRWNPNFRRQSLIKLRDYGIEIGGPIVKEHAWYWGAIGLQDIQTIAVNGAQDNTQLENLSLKVNAQATPDISLTYMYYRGDKIKKGRNAGATRPAETTWDQSTPGGLHKVEYSHILNPNLYLNVKFSSMSNQFTLTPRGGLAAQTYRTADATWHGSFLDYATDRPQMFINADTNYFLNALGGNHEFKVGFSYRRHDTESTTVWPGNMVVSDALYGTAWITRPREDYNRIQYLGIYGGDTFTKGRLTLNLGVRYDHQSGKILADTAIANPVYPDLMPGLSVTDLDAPFTWSNFSPRLGATYDVFGDGKTIIRGSFARYADQLATGFISWLSPIAPGPGELDYLWTDLNGDNIAQTDEIDFGYGPVGIYYVDPLDPQSARPTTVVDPDLKAPNRMEFIIGGEREIMPNFAVGGNFVYRKLDNQTWRVGTDYKNPDRPYTYSDYEVAGNIVGLLPGGQAYNMPYYQLKAERAGPSAGIDWLVSNREGYNEKYQGLEIFATKRLSNKWMLNASFNYQRNRVYYDGTAGISDPTNVFDGEDLAFQSASSGKSNYWIGTPKWQFLLNGMYQLPYHVSVSANLISREGFPIVYYESKFYVDPGVTEKQVRAKTIGANKLPEMLELDFRVSKVVSLGDKGNVNLDLDVFNLLNKNTPLHVYERLKRTNSNEVQDLLYPRVVRLGVRYSF